MSSVFFGLMRFGKILSSYVYRRRRCVFDILLQLVSRGEKGSARSGVECNWWDRARFAMFALEAGCEMRKQTISGKCLRRIISFFILSYCP